MQRISYRLALLVTLTAALLVTGCESGSSNISTDTPETPEDTIGDAIIGTDSPGVDSTGTDSPEPDEYTDNGGDSGPQPGEFGWPCDGPEDCDSGYCILTGEKKICTMTCVEECPEDFVCAPVTTTPPDVTYLISAYRALTSSASPAWRMLNASRSSEGAQTSASTMETRAASAALTAPTTPAPLAMTASQRRPRTGQT